MKIRCKKTSVEESDNMIINSDLSNYIIVGSIFLVYGLRFSRSTLYVYIYIDNRHLIEAPIELFDITDDRISNQWHLKKWENGDITLWPELFCEDGFLEDLAEWENEERRRFMELRTSMESEHL